jgi:hypothetical protein
MHATDNGRLATERHHSLGETLARPSSITWHEPVKRHPPQRHTADVGVCHSTACSQHTRSEVLACLDYWEDRPGVAETVDLTR